MGVLPPHHVLCLILGDVSLSICPADDLDAKIILLIIEMLESRGEISSKSATSGTSGVTVRSLKRFQQLCVVLFFTDNTLVNVLKNF